MLRELDRRAKQYRVVHDNAHIVRQTQEEVHGQLDRETLLSVLREGRGD